MRRSRLLRFDQQGMSVASYGSRSAAHRAARNACRIALAAPLYQASEGPDYEIHPVAAARTEEWWNELWAFRLRGPAGEALGTSH